MRATISHRISYQSVRHLSLTRTFGQLVPIVKPQALRISTMKAVYIDSSTAPDLDPYTVSNPAPSSALKFDTIPTPEPSQDTDILVQVKASTVIRDTLTWPEMYGEPNTIPGHDFSGTVVSTFNKDSTFQPGDEVYGMAHADRGRCWAEFTAVKSKETALKPKTLNWAQAAGVPLSTLTAWQALFHHAGLTEPDVDSIAAGAPSAKDKSSGNILITGASGAVGLLLVQLASLTPYRIVGATSSKARNEELLHELGADEVVTYDELANTPRAFEVIIDTVGGSTLQKCWNYGKPDSVLVTIDSASYDFVKEHQDQGIAKQGIKALFFIVEASGDDLSKISKIVEQGLLKTFVAAEYPLEQAKEAYDLCHTRGVGRGKVVLLM